MLRRSGNRFLIADDRKGMGEELADYSNDLGELADECAQEQPLLSPVRALEKIRAVPAPESFSGLSNHRLLRLAAAASQSAALSSRAEFYPHNMKAALALELAQGALLGSKALNVSDVQSRVAGRYPAAELLPGRPELDALVHSLDLGFQWDGSYPFPMGADKPNGAYCLPIAGLTSLASKTNTQYHYTQQGVLDGPSIQAIRKVNQEIGLAVSSARFLALSVKPRQIQAVKEKLCKDYPLKLISFDELLLRHLHQICASMPKPPDWAVVLKADAAEHNAKHWQNLQRLVQRALPAMSEEIRRAGEPILLTEPGLIARYNLVTTWLSDLRQYLMGGTEVHGLVLLMASDAQSSAASIDGVTVPAGAGSSEFSRIPGGWLELSENGVAIELA